MADESTRFEVSWGLLSASPAILVPECYVGEFFRDGIIPGLSGPFYAAADANADRATG